MDGEPGGRGSRRPISNHIPAHSKCPLYAECTKTAPAEWRTLATLAGLPLATALELPRHQCDTHLSQQESRLPQPAERAGAVHSTACCLGYRTFPEV